MKAILGGVPSGPPAQETLSLSIAEAISRALEYNLGALAAAENVERAFPRRGSR